MDCTWLVGYDSNAADAKPKSCGKPAYLHWKGRYGGGTTGVARCHEHRHLPMTARDYTTCGPFIESARVPQRRPLGPDLDEERRILRGEPFDNEERES